MMLKTIEQLKRQGCLKLSGKCFEKYTEKLENSSPENLLAYKDIPKDIKGNLIWRAFCWARMRDDPAFRRLLIDSCKNDIRFYVATFCYTYDTRKEKTIIPFIPYKYQEVLLLLIVHNANQSKVQENWTKRWDVGIDKSRTMGVSWCVLYALDFIWRFDQNRHMLCISKVAEDVDNKEDMDALFQKLDFIEERMPSALAVRGAEHNYMHGRREMNVANPENGNTIVGESSAPDAGRGGRNLVVMRDEEAFAEYGAQITKALNQTTRCQVRISTPNGISNSFYTARQREGIDWISLHWSTNPDFAAGLYSVADGKVSVIDEEWHSKNPEYEFKVEATYADPGAPWEFLRSPWFDGECAAADSVTHIQQEIQICYMGTGSPWFREDKMTILKAQHVRQPQEIGDIQDIIPERFMEKVGEFTDRDQRFDKCKAWYSLGVSGLPPQGTTYSVGIDIGAGNGGGSDSSVSVADDTTKEKVFEYRTNGLTPEDFKKACRAIALYFVTDMGMPFVGWDGGGHGGPFGTKIMEDGDLDVYYWKARGERKATRSKKPGVPSNKKIKVDIMTEYRTQIYSGGFITHSKESYDQCAQFVHDGSGGVTHNKSTTTEDKAETGEQHGDVATSEAILVWIMGERPDPTAQEVVIPEGCMASRREARRNRAKAKQERWYA